ncbi:MAG: hypothetical protein CSA75_00620 [Sorangium cellulosum]|nr:MAG: hypothetical protein CSA75_00620 [Sorangium cellulosum]
MGVISAGVALVGAAIYFGGPKDAPQLAPSAVSLGTSPPPSVLASALASAVPHLPASRTPTKRSTINQAEGPGKIESGLEGPNEMPAGQGQLEIHTGRQDAVVTVDGKDLGTGKVLKAFVRPGAHRVMVVWQTQQLRREVEVRVGKTTQFFLGDAWAP